MNLIDEDESLAEAMTAERRESARARLAVTALAVATGAWLPPLLDEPAMLGLLVVDGVLVRHVGRGTRIGAELLGPGDFIRPWQEEGDGGALGFESTWTAVTPVRLAVLDRDATEAMLEYPELVQAVLGRCVQRSRTMAVHLAIAQEPTVEARLELLLWHLADRYGRVRREGVIIPLNLTHTTLARLVAARRPSTTTALGRLCQRGVVERDADGWLLTGEPPRAGRGEIVAAARVG